MSIPTRLVAWQATVAALLATALLLVGQEEAIAALLAALAAIAPNAYFAWRAGLERSPALLLLQGVGKIALNVLLLAAVIILFRPAPLGFFGTFIALQVIHAVIAATAGTETDRAATEKAARSRNRS